MNQLQIQPIEFRDLLIEKCQWTKKEANEFVKMKLVDQFGEISDNLKLLLEEE